MLGEVSIPDIFKILFMSHLFFCVFLSLMSIYRSFFADGNYYARIDEIIFNILFIITSFATSLYYYTSGAKVFQVAAAVFLCIHIIAAGFIYNDIYYNIREVLINEILICLIGECIIEEYILKKSEKEPEFFHDWCILDGKKVEYKKEIQKPDMSKMKKVVELYLKLIPRWDTRLIELGLCSVFWFMAFRNFLHHPAPFYSIMLILLSVMVAYAASALTEKYEYGVISDLIAFLFEKVIYRSFYSELKCLKSEIYNIDCLYELPGEIKAYCKNHNMKRKDIVFLFDRYSEESVEISVCKKKHGGEFVSVGHIYGAVFNMPLYNATTINLCDVDKIYHNWFLQLHKVCDKMKKYPWLYKKIESILADERE